MNKINLMYSIKYAGSNEYRIVFKPIFSPSLFSRRVAALISVKHGYLMRVIMVAISNPLISHRVSNKCHFHLKFINSMEGALGWVGSFWGSENPLMRTARGLDTWTLAGFIDFVLGTNPG